jgi:hypothetical protein
VGPLQHDSHREGVQAPFCCPRWRTCLLQGCGRRFHSCCGRRHYCSEACRDAARRWSEWKAQQQYRSSEKGRECRREQSHRWRERQRDKGQPLRNAPANQTCRACVGHQQDVSEKISCDRPGCYVRFDASPRSPRQRFCSALCREALRRAWAREKRWRDHCDGCPLACLTDELPEGQGQLAYVRDIDAAAEARILRERTTDTRSQEVPDPRSGQRRGTLY